MLDKVQRSSLKESVACSGRTLRLSNSTLSWFVEKATPGQLQAVDDLFEHELQVRETNKHRRLLRQAHFPYIKSVDNFDHADLTFQEGYGWNKLIDLEWLDKHQDFVFHGPTGRGKTHLSLALGMLAIDRGYSVRFLSAAQLVLDLKKAQEINKLADRCSEYAKVDLIILDEFGYIPLDAEGGRLLFQVMSGSYEKQSLIITTNIEFSRWGSVLADEKLASALVDRIAHHGRLVEFGGESRRVSDSLMLGNRKED